MSFGYDPVRSIGLFLAGLLGAGLGLRVFFRWRYAAALGRARRIVSRLRAPATTLAAVEDRSSALDELVDFSDPRAAAAAVREALRENDDTIRSAAIEVLRQIRALDVWRRDLRKGSFKQKLRAIEALGDVGDERAVAELLEALGDDDPDIARAASHAICARDADYACERLAEALASPSRRLAETAAAALVRMGEFAEDYLVSQLGSLDPQARRLAAESLGSIGDEKLKDVLLPLLTAEPDPEVRTAVAGALARVDGDIAAAELQRLAHSDPDWFVRARAYSLLAELEAPGALEFLLLGLAASETDLGSFSDEGDNVEWVSDGAVRVRRAIVAGLRLLGMGEEDIAAAERRAGANPLGPEELEEASAATSLLRQRDPASRAEGARRLSEVGAAAGGVLATALGDPDPLVRAEVARSLGRIGSGDSLAALAKCLQDPDASVRLAASTALRTVVTREATKELTD